MNREIKFRAFDKQKNRMFDVYGLGKDWVTEDTLDGVDEGNNCFYGEEFKSRIKIMQFIGLKDKNGVDIYEGDILFHENHNRKTIMKWINRYACFAGETIDEIVEQEYNFYQKIDELKLEIIGNIYQNPELL